MACNNICVFHLHTKLLDSCVNHDQCLLAKDYEHNYATIVYIPSCKMYVRKML